MTLLSSFKAVHYRGIEGARQGVWNFDSQAFSELSEFLCRLASIDH